MKRALLITTALTAMTAVSAASAQNFYAGIGLDSLSVEYPWFNYKDTYGGVSGLAGYAGSFGTGGFWAAELDITRPGDNYDFDKIVRVKALIGMKIGQGTAFASAGYASTTGFLADFVGDSPLAGMTFGLGYQFPVYGGKADIRFEALQDRFDTIPGKGDFTNTQVRAAAIFNF